MDKDSKYHVIVTVQRVEDGMTVSKVTDQSWRCSIPPQKVLEEIVDLLERWEF